MRYKCHTCFIIFDGDDKVDGGCPDCGETHLEEMCDLDHLCICSRMESEGLHLCPKCGQYTCPCGSHDVLVISRVTGYLQDVNGFNQAKKQELKDRQRVTI